MFRFIHKLKYLFQFKLASLPHLCVDCLFLYFLNRLRRECENSEDDFWKIYRNFFAKLAISVGAIPIIKSNDLLHMFWPLTFEAN